MKHGCHRKSYQLFLYFETGKTQNKFVHDHRVQRSGLYWQHLYSTSLQALKHTEFTNTTEVTIIYASNH